MVKKKRNTPDKPKGPIDAVTIAMSSNASPGPVRSVKQTVSHPTGPKSLTDRAPAEITRRDWTIPLLTLMMVFTPGLGVPNEEMLQDTLKSIIASFATLIAALIFFWQQRNRREALRWHGIMVLPIALMLYALIGMTWAHTYLSGVEAIRWFIFSLIVWLGLNTITRDKFHLIAAGIHWGAVLAALWTALQFWFDFKYFPQGPNPASTFVNRNFYAEYAACTIPFSIFLLYRARSISQICIHAFTAAFVVVTIFMTGTRGALTATWLQLLVLLPLIGFLYRKQLPFSLWNSERRILAIGIYMSTLIGLSLINSGNPLIASENKGNPVSAINRAFARTGSISTNDYSLGVRFIMWKATINIIQKRPWSGVGAGSWEADLPLYQAEGSQLETDYYVHNEFLQLLAEYGLTGWLFLLLLFSYLIVAAWRTLRAQDADSLAEAPIRAIALTSLLALFIVSNVGFPWRMASTGAMFALCLAVLAASDGRLYRTSIWGCMRMNWRPALSQFGAVITMMCLALAAYITQQAAECERKIVKATKIALTITASGDYANPKWDKSKAEMLQLIKEGIDINPHYRKITPMVADELAKWGDWKNATWVWESVVSSRPYVVAIMSNVARGYATLGNIDKALVYLERSKRIQPKAPSVRSLEVVLLSRSGKESKALDLAREAIDLKIYDHDLVNAAFVLAWRAGDFQFALKTLDIRMKEWPTTRVLGLLQLGNLYTTGLKDSGKAFESFKTAMDATSPDQRQSLLPQIPPVYWPKLGFGHITPVMPNQTSSTKK